jgi:hypothetical protein
MNKVLYIILIIIFLQSALVVDGAVGPGTSESSASAGPSRVSSGGGGSRLPDVDSFIRQVEYWKTNYKDRFDYLQSLLYKPNFTTTKYVPPGVWLYYPSKNKTLSRNDPIEIGALVVNSNPIEIRRVLYLTLLIQDPGENDFKPAKAAVQIVQVNDYDETQETCLRIFPDFSSFGYLRQVGDVRLNVYITDGQYKYDSSIQTDDPEKGYYHELSLKIYNNPPQINNTTMSVNPDNARWDDYIQYTASLEDTTNGQNKEILSNKEENPILSTLYVYNNSEEVFNKTKPFFPGDTILFSTKDASIFKEKDAGKNFTYRYSCTDGIKSGDNITWTKLGEGPHIRPNPKIKVSDLKAGCEDENYYWWQNYNFGLKAKSLSTESVDLRVDLYTDTPVHPGKRIASQAIHVPTNESVDIIFRDVKPFDVSDVNQTFHYYFRYSAPDQDGKSQSNIMTDPNPINTKLISFETISGPSLSNIGLILLAALLVSMFVERRFYR